MSCIQTLKGIGQDCATNLAGIKEVYLANVDDVAEITVTESAHTVSGITMEEGKLFQVYKFAKQTGSLTSEVTIDEANGVRFYTNTLTLQFNKMEAAKHLEVEAMAAGQLVGIALDNNGKYWLLGKDSYLSATAVTGQTGQSFTDLNGYTTTLSSMESTMPFEVSKEIVEGLIG